MSEPEILIAEELRDLLDHERLAAWVVGWMAPGAPTPAGAALAVIPLLTRRLGRAELDRLPHVRIIANAAVGYDNIDLGTARDRGIVVTNTPDVLTESTADLTWALILAAARRLKEGQELLRGGSWSGWDPNLLLGVELHGRVLGVIGAGRIGAAVARRAIGFGMRVVYGSRSRKPALERATGAEFQKLDHLLATADVVSLHLPLTDETRGIINAARLRGIKRGAIVVNTARGGLVDEAALLAAIDSGVVFAAGLDVFAGEPTVPPALVAHPRVVCLPHLGSATRETRSAMADLAAKNVMEVLSGRPPVTPVDR